MPFQKGNKLGVGGRQNPPGGRPTKAAQLQKLQAAEIARALLEAEIEPILREYCRLAKGGLMRKGQSPQTTRHCIERWLPPAKAFLQIDAKIGFEQLIADLEAEVA